MTAKPEATLTKKILKRLKKEGGFWAKIHGGPYQVTGLPDIIGCYQGRFYGYEVKVSERDKPTARQALALSLIAQAGGVSRVIRSFSDAINAIQESHIELYAHRKWLSASQACVKLGLALGDKPISRWRLMRLVEEGEVKVRPYGGRKYYSAKSVDDFLNRG